MTAVVMRGPWGNIPAVCDVCERETGNLARHRPACARRAGEVVSTTNLSDADRIKVIRAGCHATAEVMLDRDAQLREGVTDLDVARVLLALEGGALIIPGPRNSTRWMAPHGSPLRAMDGTYERRSLNRVVGEMIRLGLAYVATQRTGPSSFRRFLAPALVHARGGRGRPACGGPTTTIKRFRLVDELTLVDCQACVDALS